MGIIITRNKRAEKITDLTGNSKKALKVYSTFEEIWDPQNGVYQ